MNVSKNCAGTRVLYKFSNLIFSKIELCIKKILFFLSDLLFHVEFWDILNERIADIK